MASYASVTGETEISAKYRGIRVKIPDASAADIVEGLCLKCHIDDIETVQSMPGKGNWVVVFTKEDLVNTCLLGLKVNDKQVIPVRVAKERYVYASVHYVPPDISNEEIEEALMKFTEVKSIKHQYMRDYPGIKTGKRLVILKPRQQLPPYFDVGEVRATLMFKGRIACCPYCDETNHLGRDCQNKRAKKTCYYCHETGHYKRDCPLLNTSLPPDEDKEKEQPQTDDKEEQAADNKDGRDDSKEPETDNDETQDDNAKVEEMATDDGKEAELSAETLSSPLPTPPSNTDSLDLQFAKTPVVFSPPSPTTIKKPSPPVEITLSNSFAILAPTEIAPAPPPKEESAGAKHKMPQICSTVPGDKRPSKESSPRAGFRFPRKKQDKEQLAAATRNLDPTK